MSEESRFWVGDRIEYDPAEFGVVLPPVPSDLRSRWNTGTPPVWKVTIGSYDS